MAKKSNTTKSKKSTKQQEKLIDNAEIVTDTESINSDSDFDSNVEVTAQLFQSEEQESEGFLPQVDESLSESLSDSENLLLTENSSVNLEGSELDGFESAQIDEVEFVEEEQAQSIIESILFASDRPVSLASIREVFKGTNIRKDKIKRIIDNLSVEYASGSRGVTLEEITAGYQLRTKIDNMNFIRRTIKARSFKLSGPALETLAIVAYKQPVVKNEIDQIRGVESGHLLRALMEKGLCSFEGKAEDLPGRPMQYGTTRKFLEIFGLRNLKELPTLSQIDELLPEGIGDEEEEKPTLSTVTDSMSTEVKDISYSQGEEELGLIEADLETISTSSDFFEQEKIRQKQKRDAEKAQDIRDAITMGEDVPRRDVNWLKKYDEAILLVEQGSSVPLNFIEDEQESKELQAAENAVSLAEDISSADDELGDDLTDELPMFEEADDDGDIEPSRDGDLT